MTNYEFSLRHAAVYDPRLPRQLESPRLLRRSCPLRQRLAADVRGGFAEVLCGVGQHLVLELSTKVRESRRQDLTKGCMSAMIINQLAALRIYARYKPGTVKLRAGSLSALPCTWAASPAAAAGPPRRPRAHTESCHCTNTDTSRSL